jgi:hypothetical protein
MVASTSKTWQYLNCYPVTWLLDGKTILKPDTTHDGSVGSGFVTEQVYTKLTLAEFLQIVNANKVEVKLCNTEFALTSAEMNALRDFASRMRPK